MADGQDGNRDTGTVRPKFQIGPESLKDIFRPGHVNPQTGPQDGSRPQNDFRPKPEYNPHQDFRPVPQNVPHHDLRPKIRPEHNPQGFPPRSIGPESLKDIFIPNPDQIYRPQPQQDHIHKPKPNIGRMVVGGILQEVLGVQPQPQYDPRYPQYDPRYPQHDPRYPQHDPRYPQYDPRYPQPGQFVPQQSPLDIISQPGPVRDLIRNKLGRVIQNNPEAFQEIVNAVGGMSPDVQFNIDQQTRTLNLAMDFTRPYDKMVQNNPAAENPEVRKLLGGLSSISANPDQMVLNWKNEQILTPGDQGAAKGFKIALGGGSNQTSFDLNTTQTSLIVSNIRGVEAIDPDGRRLRVHQIDMDTSDPNGPRGGIIVDNPFERPKNMPANVEWPATVTLPIALDPKTQSHIIQGLPSAIRNLDTARNAVKNGDLSQLSNIDLQSMMTLFTPPAPNPNDISPRPQIDPHPQVDPRPQVDRQVVPPPPEPESKEETVRQKIDISKLPLTMPVKKTQQILEAPPKPQTENKKTETQTEAKRRIIRKPLAGGSSLGPGKTTTFIMDALADQKPVAREQSGGIDYLNPIRTDTTKPRETVPARVLPEPGSEAPPERTVKTKPETKLSNAPTEDSAAAALLKQKGIDVKAESVGVERLVEIFLADADQNGPLIKEIKGQMSSTAFRQKAAEIGNTLNRFDVDKANKTITVGMDFGKVYDAASADLPADKQSPETRRFLSTLDSVTVGATKIKLQTRGDQPLPMLDKDGSKKADLWFGSTTGGTTSIDIQTTETSLTLKNIQGLEAEIPIVGRVNVRELNIDVSDPDNPRGTALVDNPLPRPPSVPPEYWTVSKSLDMDPGDAQKRAEMAERLPKTIKSVHSMMQGAQSGKVAERIGNLTKEDIKKILQSGA